MKRSDYSYVFGDIADGLSSVRVTDHTKDVSWEARATIRDNQILSEIGQCTSPIVADIADLALAVAFADRFSSRREDTEYRIEIALPMRKPEVFSGILDSLESILYWFTDDHWSFQFTHRDTDGRFAERQPYLWSPGESKQPVEVALWSGGLDALSGLYNRLLADPCSQHILVGSGSNNYIHSTQRSLAGMVEDSFPDRTKLVQIPLRWNGTKSIRKESSSRTRGFVFLLLGAACATLAHQNTLSIYENGMGAINLPFRESEVGLDHSRSVHPISLRDMSNFVSRLLGAPFQFHNPFLFSTKAQMCAVLRRSEAMPLVHRSVSCDRRLRARPTQCGQCSSCLLRRLALAIQGIEENVKETYICTESRDGAHFQAMLSQIETLRSCRLDADDSWYRLTERYPSLLEVTDCIAAQEGKGVSEVIESLTHLYHCYVQEWDSVWNLPSNVRRVA